MQPRESAPWSRPPEALHDDVPCETPGQWQRRFPRHEHSTGVDIKGISVNRFQHSLVDKGATAGLPSNSDTFTLPKDVPLPSNNPMYFNPGLTFISASHPRYNADDIRWPFWYDLPIKVINFGWYGFSPAFSDIKSFICSKVARRRALRVPSPRLPWGIGPLQYWEPLSFGNPWVVSRPCFL